LLWAVAPRAGIHDPCSGDAARSRCSPRGRRRPTAQREGEGARHLPAEPTQDGQAFLARRNSQPGVFDRVTWVQVPATGDILDLAVQTFGRIDVLFNNAAMARFNWLEDISDEEWDPIAGRKSTWCSF
jgi:NAD(P)-dependent dehydrogenase (short-subunit alcohol dehydrogenase family)